MKIGIAVFAYIRSYHLRKVLDGLKKNDKFDKLYLFQDGIKNENDRAKWNEVNEIIHSVNWCKTEIRISGENQGLAAAIVNGINYVFEENDAIIVLEDDCVPHQDFIAFMIQCFEKYNSTKDVYCVSGHSWPVNLGDSNDDIYFCGRFSSWGWGTWKDRWQEYHEDYSLLKQIKNNEELSKGLALWGNDLENMLEEHVKGNINSWAVFMALEIIKKQGKCINPYMPLIENIGFDGTGIHCDATNLKMNITDKRINRICFPDNTVIYESTKEAFKELFGSSIATVGKRSTLPKVLVYGIGKFYHENENVLCQKYNIIGYIDRNKKGFYAGRKISVCGKIFDFDYDNILIMIKDINECFKIIRELINQYKINSSRIILGYSAIGYKDGYLEYIQIQENGSLCFCKNKVNITMRSLDEVNNVREVWGNHNYLYHISNKNNDIVLDIGMNIADSTIYFLQNPNVKKVYGFEPFPETFKSAEENLHNSGFDNCPRVDIFNYGLSNVDEERKIVFNCNMSCGQSSIKKINDQAHLFYENNALISAEDNNSIAIKVKNASSVFNEIFDELQHENIILKVDCEGEEYAILRDLDQQKLINRVDFIMLEWHYEGKGELISILDKNHFSYWCFDKSTDMGMIYAIHNRNLGETG